LLLRNVPSKRASCRGEFLAFFIFGINDLSRSSKLENAVILPAAACRTFRHFQSRSAGPAQIKQALSGTTEPKGN
jgi:hypothetical protein